MYPRTHGRFPTLMNRPTSHPEQRLLLVRVSDNNNDENTKLIVTSFYRKNVEGDANNNTSCPSSSDVSVVVDSSQIQASIHIVNINLDDVIKFFDEHPSSFIFTKGPEPIRHFLIPLFVSNERFVPHQLLNYYDICTIFEDYNDEDEQAAKSILELNEEQIEEIHKVVNIEYKAAPIFAENVSQSSDDVVCRARGLPWQASDQHVAQFFAGLEIVSGGIALCLSSEGRRNGEVLVQFVNQESRDLALKRHRNFLLSRYIEVYKATMEEFLHVASGSSEEAMEFLSTNAVTVRMRGLPYDCTDAQIKKFFEPLQILDRILYITRSDGRPTGDAFVQFETEEEAQDALLRHRKTIGQRYIELFKSTAAEVQQVVKRCNNINNNVSTNAQSSMVSVEQPDFKRKDCIRLRGLPYEAQVQHIVTFLGEYAKLVICQGVHMIYNNQGHPSGEAFIQMINEQAAFATATTIHNKYMNVGKKQRYIEVFQCSPEDLNLQHLVKQAPIAAPPQMAFLGHPPAIINPAQQQQFWSSYPSPPISPILPGQMTQVIVCGITMNTGIPEIVQKFSTHEIQVENVVFTRWPSPICPGEAILTIRSRAAPNGHVPPPTGHIPPQAPLGYPYSTQQFVQQPAAVMME